MTGFIVLGAVILGALVNAMEVPWYSRGRVGEGSVLWAEQIFGWRVAIQDAGDWLLVGTGTFFLLLVLVSFLRCGPRGWLAEIRPSTEHDHAHHPGAEHGHHGREQIQIDVADEA